MLHAVVACGAVRRYQGPAAGPDCRLQVVSCLTVSFGLPLEHYGDTNGIPDMETQLDPEEFLPLGRFGGTNGRTPGTSLRST